MLPSLILNKKKILFDAFKLPVTTVSMLGCGQADRSLIS